MNRTSIVLACALCAPAVLASAAGAAVLTRGPYLQSGSPTSVVVRWRSDVATDSRVRYGPSPGSLTSFADHSGVVTEHEVRLTGLEPDTPYYYSVGSAAETIAGGDSLRFVTSPPSGPPRPMRIWVLGDAGTAGVQQRAVRDGYARYNGDRRTDFVMLLGDNAYNSGLDTEYQNAVFGMYPKWLRESVLWPTRGNHDGVYAGTGNDYYDFFTLPSLGEAGGTPSGSEAYYSFDYANVHFICMDSEGTSITPGGAMLTWLQSDIAASPADWVVAFWHHPPYTKGSHNSDNPGDSFGKMRDMREDVLPILEEAGVDLVLTGHSHSYERSFLLDGHYDVSTTLTAAMIKDGGDGRPDGDGAYVKTGPGATSHEGAVYVVAGSAGQASGGSLNHPVMITSQNRIGSLVLDIDGQRLEARFVDDSSVVRDSFAVQKVGPLSVREKAPSQLGLDLAPNPSAGESQIRFTLPAAGHVRVTLLDVRGRRVRTLADLDLPAGTHAVVWDGADARRRPASPGVYFAVVEAGGRVEAGKIIRTR